MGSKQVVAALAGVTTRVRLATTCIYRQQVRASNQVNSGSLQNHEAFH